MNATFISKTGPLDLASIAELAGQLLQSVPTPVVLGLVGTLGAGKTSLTQELARAAGIDAADVTSPTFTLLQSHQGNAPSGPITIHHLDAYRVADEDEFLELGVDEMFEQKDAWTIVEWADRVETVMPADTLWLKIEIESDDLRVVSCFCDNKVMAERLAQVSMFGSTQ